MLRSVLIVALSFSCVASVLAQAPLRKLAPGVVTEIAPKIEEEETFTGPTEMTELMALGDLNWQPKTLADSETLLAMAKQVTYRRQIWALEFGFKPLRIINVNGKKVYYLVYYVKNNGRHLNPTAQDDGTGNTTFRPEPVKHTIRFFPNFVLQAHDVDRAYLDEVVPGAIDAIRRREDPGRKFYDSVAISSIPIPVSATGEDNSVWGVATWTDVDPRSDFFSVYVKGLTNAYRWTDTPGAFKAGSEPMTGRNFRYKTLQLNFWRAGDAINATEDEIRFGVPNQNQVPSAGSEDDILKIYQLQERVDYLWIYQ